MDELILTIRDLNIELHRKFARENDDEIYTPTMLNYLNGLDGLTVRFFSDVSDINVFLKNIHHIKSFMKFYESVNGNTVDSLLVYDYDVGLYFLENGEFQTFVEDVLKDSDDEEILKFNKLIMGKIYGNKGYE